MSTGRQEPDATGVEGQGLWAGYLDWIREEAIDAVTSLPEADQRASRVPSGWSPLELLHHLFHMERRWFVWGFLGEQIDRPWGDWDVADPESDPAGRWRVPPGLTAGELAGRLRAQGKRTRAVLAEHALHDRARTGGRFTSQAPTLEWICFHVLTEYARHAGQLDIVVEGVN